jgi:hypothetical protein
MDRNTIKKEIVELVSSIKGQSDTLANERYPSQLDLELFLHKVERLYQKSIVFHHLTTFDGFEEIDTPRTPVIEPVPEIKQSEKAVETVSNPIVSEPKNIPVIVGEVTPPLQKVESKPVVETKQEPVKRQNSLPDLKSAMGINDKFQFTNELFKGSMQEFNIAIEQLNASASIESALNYLKSLHQLYGWDDEHDTLKRFLSIIERRYS